jgi:hypothetical protein
MALLKGSVPMILVGVGAAVAAPVVIPAIAGVARPLVKGAVRGILALSDQVTELFAEVGEQWSDLVAEARAERSGSTPSAESLATVKPRPAPTRA